MKKIFFVSGFILAAFFSYSQDMTKFKLYSPVDNAGKGIESAVKEAREAGKHVFLQIGGNWCIWCARFNDFVTSDKSIDSLIHANYVVYHLNYSKENYNARLLANYGFPQRFGFPVFLVLDGGGKLIHTQNSAYLEEGKSYSKGKVVGFFNDWTPKVFNPGNYIEK